MLYCKALEGWNRCSEMLECIGSRLRTYRYIRRHSASCREVEEKAAAALLSSVSHSTVAIVGLAALRRLSSSSESTTLPLYPPLPIDLPSFQPDFVFFLVEDEGNSPSGSRLDNGGSSSSFTAAADRSAVPTRRAHSFALAVRGGDFFRTLLCSRDFTATDGISVAFSEEALDAFLEWLYTGTAPVLDRLSECRARPRRTSPTGHVSSSDGRSRAEEDGYASEEDVALLLELLYVADRFMCEELQGQVQMLLAGLLDGGRVDRLSALQCALAADNLALPLLSAELQWRIGRYPSVFGLEGWVVREHAITVGQEVAEEAMMDKGGSNAKGMKTSEEEGETRQSGSDLERERERQRTTSQQLSGEAELWLSLSRGFRLGCLCVRQRFERFAVERNCEKDRSAANETWHASLSSPLRHQRSRLSALRRPLSLGRIAEEDPDVSALLRVLRNEPLYRLLPLR